MDRLLTNYYETGAIILFGIGFATLLLHNNLIKKIIGLNIMDTAVFLFFIAKGYISGREAPIITEKFKGVNSYINPIPTSLMLTGIVVAVSTTAFALALTVKIYEKYGTIELDEILENEEE
ncbi:multicomponent Na+:H+ antiporter subunit C [Clostridium tetanomorphum]|uniref:Cation:proton antiporter subunit C n=1 Tax=Clostridium tetanomorphum TaxID=1553 RepID=A0A923J1S2_CLOTT|nr:cation:proton antiporter subunit C [Clostridium tetanomorphum]KAJ52476.1 sodium/proton antiporter [Clostridium tetanomorphum DSM 665]MBC2399492.1 cation:proton antiporter subunit C [Clostridium tetanomorphum]MBP1864155.1 multicomponent Na+:H+ antiporter subunit C [Clostridium tetanomorphum]NRS84568.1 multicomponent Na+:H+ antiporter subunit C [Clostridium tetanomorphum]NRZ97782.1 multicomponent Na+:H+ antiporter subunit C [Clostridium tetanomorphum]